jgi:3-dehydroquinate synthase
MTHVRVELGTRSYDILIRDGALADAAQILSPFATRGRLIVIADEQVAEHQLPHLLNAFSASEIAIEQIILPAGEGSKSWAQLEALTDQLLALGLERGEHIIALGGGVIGDLAGFAASIVKRGCGFIQIPTSLLAQVDSSVGGKTAINSRAGKNLVGAFHQPSLVIIDPGVLDSLPAREMRAGYAEVVKYGLIDDADFFGWCEQHGQDLLAGDRAAQITAITRSVTAKARIVGEDETERTGRRALLNLGHTFGHALEAETGFSAALLHGEAVAAGMALAFRYSVRRGHCDLSDADRVASHIAAAGLPDGLKAAGVKATGAALVAHMAHDKKMEGGTLPFLLAKGIGQTFLADDVELADVARFLDSERETGR